MINGGNVRSSLDGLQSSFSKYQDTISSLADNWKGTSFDSINEKCNSFLSEFKGAIDGQMNSFASACDTYEIYIKCKRDLEEKQSLYNSCDESKKSYYANMVKDLTTQLDELKRMIEDLLSAASSTSLDASGISTVSLASTSSRGSSGLTSAQTEAVLNAADSQLGVAYWSLHYGPRGSGEEGFGCAMFVSYCYNEALFDGARGDDWDTPGFYGSTYEYWGNVTSDGYNPHNKSFVEVSEEEAQPGDVVCYITEGTDPYATVENCPHVALYVGDGQIVGSAVNGVERGDVDSQAYGTVPHYLHYIGSEKEESDSK